MKFLLIACLILTSFNLLATTTSVSFSGYKFLSKVKVSGVFTDVKTTHNKKHTDLKSFLKSIEVKILTNSIETKDRSRNKNILTTLFATKGSSTITATTKKVNLKKNHIIMNVQIENIIKEVTFNYNKTKDLIIFATTLDLVEFGLGKQFSNFSKKCSVFHTDTNGVEKTWSIVDITVKSSLPKY
jgi:hypothetical protein